MLEADEAADIEEVHAWAAGLDALSTESQPPPAAAAGLSRLTEADLVRLLDQGVRSIGTRGVSLNVALSAILSAVSHSSWPAMAILSVASRPNLVLVPLTCRSTSAVAVGSQGWRLAEQQVA